MAIFEKEVALTPAAGGGQCITEAALRPADIIVSTTKAVVSGIVRVGTASTVSHAALYMGDGNVIEAIEQGVVKRTLKVALADDLLAVAYRAPKLDSAAADRIIKFVAAQVNKKYSKPRAFMSALPLCHIISSNPATFFCSQLVFEGFKQGGVPLTGKTSDCITPGDVVTIAQSQLIYVGHLLGEPSWFPVVAP